MIRIVILIATTMLFSACDHSQATQAQHSPSHYNSQWFEPEQQQKKHKITAFVEPTDNATLAFQVAGTIIKEHVLIGDVVSEGDVLFELSNPALGPKITQLSAELSAIEATIKQNQAELARLQDLKKSNAVSQNDLDKLANQNDNLLAKKRSLESQKEEAQSLFDETTLTAPFAGTVAEIFKKNGETINAGEPVMLLGGVDSLQAPLFIPSHLQKSLAQGQTLEAEYQGQHFQATIKEISHAANPKSQLFKVVLDIPMALGMKSGEQIISYVPEALGMHYALPFEAVIDDGINKPYLLVIDQQKVTQVFTTIIGLRGENILLDIKTDIGNIGAIQVVTEGHSHLTVGQHLIQAETDS